jgi:hypothetical protein
MGLALDYGSDDEEEEQEQVTVPEPAAAPVVAPIASTSSLGLPPPKNKKRALKIGFDHPLLSAPTFGAASSDDVEERTSKRQRVKDAGEEEIQDRKGKGKSTLLDMLPPPKRTAPAASSTTATTPKVEEQEEEDAPLVPRKLAKQAGKAPAEPASLDLFGLGELSSAWIQKCTLAHASLSINSRSITFHLDSKTFINIPDHLLCSCNPRIRPAPTNTPRPIPRLLPTPNNPSMACIPGINLQGVHRIYRPFIRRCGPGTRRTRVGWSWRCGWGRACGCADKDGE